MRCEHGDDESLCVPCAIAGEPAHFKLGRQLAQALRNRFGDDAEKALGDCRELAAESGDALQIASVRMAEKFLIGRKAIQ